MIQQKNFTKENFWNILTELQHSNYCYRRYSLLVSYLIRIVSIDYHLFEFY